MSKSPKLIILRGQSGSGKSTIAKALKQQSSRAIVILDHDYYRVHLLPAVDAQTAVRDASAEMLAQNALTALKYGFDVILEGILTMPNYKPMLDELITAHPSENYAFYFDTSFEETVKRHHSRDKSKDFGEAEMREWYKKTVPTDYHFEKKIPETFTLEQTLTYIRQRTKI